MDVDSAPIIVVWFLHFIALCVWLSIRPDHDPRLQQMEPLICRDEFSYQALLFKSALHHRRLYLGYRDSTLLQILWPVIGRRPLLLKASSKDSKKHTYEEISSIHDSLDDLLVVVASIECLCFLPFHISWRFLSLTNHCRFETFFNGVY